MQEISTTPGNLIFKKIAFSALFVLTLISGLSSASASISPLGEEGFSSNKFGSPVRLSTFSYKRVVAAASSVSQSLPAHIANVRSSVTPAVESIPTDLASNLLPVNQVPKLAFSFPTFDFPAIPSLSDVQFAQVRADATQEESGVRFSGTEARTIGVAGTGISLIGGMTPSMFVPKVLTSTLFSTSTFSSWKMASAKVPRIAQASLLPFSSVAYEVNSDAESLVTNSSAPQVLGVSTTAAALTKPTAIPFLDRISLSIYCAFASRSPLFDPARCDYDALTRGNTPPVATLPVATTTPSVVDDIFTPRDNAGTVYITQYVTRYVGVEGRPGRDGVDGADGRDGLNGLNGASGMDGLTSFNNMQVAPGYGAYYPSINNNTNSQTGISTIGYLKDVTIDTPIINRGTATGLSLINPTVSNGVFNGTSLFNDTAIFTGNVAINNFTATSSSFLYATTTNAYVQNLFSASSTLVDAVLTNSTTTNSYVTNLFVDAATTTDSYITRLIAASSTLTDAMLTNSTTTNAYVANLVAASSTLTDALISYANIGTLVAASSTFTDAIIANSTTTNAYINNLSVGSTTATDALFTNATSTNFFATSSTLVNATSSNLFAELFTALTGYFTDLTATNATTTNLFTQNLAVGNASTTGDMSIDGMFNVTGTSTLGADVYLNGNVVVGTSSNELLTVNALINSNITPASNKTYDLGSPSFYWNTLYADSINVNSISAASTTISGTASNVFSINTDNSTVDTEDVSLVFVRGLVNPNALIRWNAAQKRLESNMSFKVQNETPGTGTTTLTVQSGVGQGATNLFELVNNVGTKLSVFNANGWLGIGSSTPGSALTVVGDTYLGGNVTATGTLTVAGFTNTGTTTLTNASATALTATDLFATNATLTNTVLTNATATNFFTTILNAVTAAFTNLTSTGTSTFATNGGNVGIGTTTPGSKLSVQGDGYFGGNLTATGTLTVGGLVNTGNSSFVNASTTNLTVSNNAYFGGNTGIWNGSGNVGVGTTSPEERLTLIGATANGSGNIFTAYSASSTLRTVLDVRGAQTWYVQDNSNVERGSISYSTPGGVPGILFRNTSGNGRSQIKQLASTGGLSFGASTGAIDTDLMVLTTAGNVGIGTTTPSSRLSVEGDTYFGGNSTTTGITRFTNTTDASTRNIASVTFAGGIGVSGRSVFGNPGSGIYGQAVTFAISTSSASGANGLVSDMRQAGNGAFNGNYLQSTASGASMSTANSLISIARYAGTGTLVNLTGIRSEMTVSGGGTTTNAYSFYAEAMNNVASGLTNAYGLYLEDNTAAMNNWGIYSAGTLKSYFGGNVGIGSTTPGYKLTVAGDAYIGGNLIATGSATFLGTTTFSGPSAFTTLTSTGTSTFATAGGNVGVGTLTPTQSRLVIQTPGSASAESGLALVNGGGGVSGTSVSVDFYSRNTGNGILSQIVGGSGVGPTGNLAFNTYKSGTLTTSMMIDTVGNVGIGTTTPGSLLTVAGTVTIPTIGTALSLGVNSISSESIISFNNNRGFLGYSSTSLGGTESMVLQSGSGKNLAFMVHSSNFAIGTPAMLINHLTGNVGIGTTTPLNKLFVSGVGVVAGFGDGSVSQNAAISVSAVDASVGRAMFGYNGATSNAVVQGTSGKGIEFNVNNLFGSGTAAVITTAGNVGIGTTTPSSKLTVYNDANNYVNLVSSSGYSSFVRSIASGAVAGMTQMNTAGYGLTIQTAGTSTADYALNVTSNSGNTTGLRVTNAGSVGIGTTAPTRQLEVINSSSGATLHLLRLSNYSNSVNTGAGMEFVSDVSGYVGSSIVGLRTATAGPGHALQFNLNQSERMRIDSTGNVGIGTTNPTAVLNVVKNSTYSAEGSAGFRIEDGTSDVALLMGTDAVNDVAYIQSLDPATSYATRPLSLNPNGGNVTMAYYGNVGIGTTTPASKLDVYGIVTSSGPNAKFVVPNPNNVNANLEFSWLNDIARVRYGGSGVGASGGFQIQGPGDVVKWGVDQSGNSIQSGTLTVQGAGNSSFVGNVGIGTTTPTSKLEIVNTGNFTASTGGGLLLSGSGSNGEGVTINSTATGGRRYSMFSTADGSSAGGGKLSIFDNTADAHRLTVDSSGNIGIGTTAPDAKLHVMGGAFLQTGSGLSLRFGANINATTLTNNTRKFGRIGFPHYDLSEQDVMFLVGDSDGTDNIMFLGGGSNAYNAATRIEFKTAATAITTNGTTRMTIDSTGNVGIGTTTPGSLLTVGGNAYINGSATTTGVFTSLNTISLPVDGTRINFANDGANGYLRSSGGTLSLINSAGGAGNDSLIIGTLQGDRRLSLRSDVTRFSNFNNSVEYGRFMEGSLLVGTTTASSTLFVQGSGLKPSFTLASSTGETQFTVLATGNVGIGTTSPANALDVVGNIRASGKFLVADGTLGAPSITFNNDSSVGIYKPGVQGLAIAGGGIEIARFLSSGNVGIGTTTPSYNLSVAGTTGLGITNAGGVAALQLLGNAASAEDINFGVVGGVSAAGKIRYSNTMGAMSFSTSQTTRLTIDSIGNVGIGTSTPIVPLDVVSATAIIASFGQMTPTTQGISINGGRVQFGHNNTTQNAYILATSGRGIEFSTNSSGVGNNIATVITSAGNVGIGTTTPSDKLTLGSGNIRISGTGPNNGIFADNTSGVGIFSLTRQNTVATGDLSISAFGGIGLTGNNSSSTSGIASGYSLYVASTGNVGIGTTTPGARLHVQGTSTGNVLIGALSDLSSFGGIGFQSTLNSTNYALASSITSGTIINTNPGKMLAFRIGNADKMVLDQNGNVGIGTTTPESLLSLVNNISGQSQLTFQNTSFSGYAGLNLKDSNNVLAGSLTYSNSSAAALPSSMWIGTRNAVDSLHLVTGSVSPTPRLTVTSGGNVGIGTTTPTTPLYIASTSPTLLTLDRSAGGTNANMAFKVNGGFSTYAGLGLGGSGFAVGPTQDLGNATSTWMTITSNGNVGIGTTTPNAKFQVVGGTNGNEFLSLFTQNGIVPEPSAGLPFISNKAVMVQGDGGAFFVGRDVTNDIEFAMGSSVVGEAFSGSITNHNYSLRTNNTNRLTIATSGNVGIGVTSPGYTFVVATTSANTAGLMRDVPGGNPGSGAAIGRLMFGVYNSSNGSNLLSSMITSVTTETWVSTTSRGSALSFSTVPNGSLTSAEAMRIDSTGNVGIGTTNPTLGKLQLVQTTDSSSGGFTVSNAAITGTARLWVDGNNIARLDSSSTGNVNLSLNGSGTGNVGIGTTTASFPLTVNGNIGLLPNGSTNRRIDFGTSFGAAALSLYTLGGVPTWGWGLNPGEMQFFGTGNLGDHISFNRGGSFQSSGTNEVMRINLNTGNVGIGTTSPGSKLSVQGDGYFGGNLTATGTLTVGGLVNTGNSSFTTLTSTGTSTFATLGGNVGIGIASPSANLEVGSLSGNGIIKMTNPGSTFESALYFREGATDTARFTYNSGTNNLSIDDIVGGFSIATFVRGTGNVGIGTTNPASKLHVEGTSAAGVLTLSNSATSISSGSVLGKIDFYSNDASAGSSGVLSSIQSIAEGSFSASNVARTGLAFSTYPTGISATLTERMRIDGAGNVGIGTTTPNALLSLYSTSGGANSVNLGPLGASSLAAIGFGNSALSATTYSLAGDGSRTILNAPTGDLEFRIANVTAPNALIIKATTGNVGIGTTTPASKLDVYGIVTSSGPNAKFVVPNPNNSNASIEFSWLNDIARVRYGGIGTGSSNGFRIQGPGDAVKWSVNDLGNTTQPGTLTVQGAGSSSFVGNVGIGTTTPSTLLHLVAPSLAIGTVESSNAINSALWRTKTTDGVTFDFRLNGPTAPSNPSTAVIGTSGLQPITFFQSGIERMRVDSNGNVGIGTSTPAQILDIYRSVNAATRAIVTNPNTGTGAIAALTVSNNSNDNDDGLEMRAFGTSYTTAGSNIQDSTALMSGSNVSGGLSIVNRNTTSPIRFYTGGSLEANERMRILSGGNVGIGTTTPNTTLTVTSSGANGINIDADTSNAMVSGRLFLSNATPGQSVVLRNSSGALEFFTAGTVGTDTGTSRMSLSQSGILTVATGVFTTLTSTGTSTFATLGGNVGIGTITPVQSRLVIQTPGSASAESGLALVNGGGGVSGTSVSVDFYSRNTGNGILSQIVGGSGVGPTGNLAFNTYKSGALTTSMMIDTIGNVGIGTTTPSSRLTVVGSGTYNPSLIGGSAATAQIGAGGSYELAMSQTASAPFAYWMQVRHATANISGPLALNPLGGNVGIGTTTPSEMLQLSTGSGGGDVPRLKFTNLSTGYGATDGMFVGVSNTSQLDIWNNEANSIRFGTASTLRMVIDSTGNVGIGTTTPGNKLTVWGTGDVLNLGDNTNTSTYGLVSGGRMFYGYDGANAVLQGGLTKGIEFNVNNNTFGSGTAMVIDSTGNVGIGTTTPGYKFTVAGDIYAAAGGDIRIGSGGTGVDSLIYSNNGEMTFNVGGSVRQTIDSNGLVGIGTTSPVANLEVVGIIQNTSNAATSYGRIFTLNSTNSLLTDMRSYGATASGTLLGNNVANSGFLISNSSTAFGVGNISGPLFFGAGNAERMRITATGNVGIGTATPVAKLDVVGTGDSSAAIFTNTNVITGPVVDIIGPVSTSTDTGKAFSVKVAGSSFASGLFYTDGKYGIGSGNAMRDTFLSRLATSTLRISSDGGSGLANLIVNGNVGIGTTNPLHALDVAGSGVANSAIRVNAHPGNGNSLFITNRTSTSNSATVNYSTGGATDWTTGMPYATLGSSGSNYVISDGTGNARFAIDKATGNVGIGTTSPANALDVVGNIRASGKFLVADGTLGAPSITFNNDSSVGIYKPGVQGLAIAGGGIEIARFLSSGNVGIGTTTATQRLTVNGNGLFAGNLYPSTDAAYDIGSSTARWNNVYAANMNVSNLVASTTVSDYFTAASSTATSNFAGGMSVANGSLLVDAVTGVTSISNAAFGNLSFDADAGQVSWVDLPITALTATGTIQSYTAQLGGNPMLTVYGEHDGTGNIQNPRFGFGTTTPTSYAQIVGTGSSPLLTVGTSTNQSIFNVLANGNVGIGSSTPRSLFTVASSTGSSLFEVNSFGNAVLGGATPITSGSGVFVTNLRDSIGTFRGTVSINTPNSMPGFIFTDASSVSRSDIRLLPGGGFAFAATSTAQAPSVSMAITANGNVGIGTTSPTGRLEIYDGSGTALVIDTPNVNSMFRLKRNGTEYGALYNLATGGDLYLRSAGNLYLSGGAAAQQVTINSAGSVGVGTTLPNAKLDILSSLAGTSLTGDPSLAVIQSSDGIGAGGSIVLSGYRNGTILSSGTYIKAYKESATASDLAYGLRFGVRASGSAGNAEAMAISGNGNVGIGTATPNAKLQIAGIGTLVSIGDGGISDQTAAMFSGGRGYVGYGGNSVYVGGNQSMVLQSGLAKGLAFIVNNSTFASGTQAMSIDSNGNVGIGTTNPAAKFVVSNGGAVGFEVDNSTFASTTLVTSYNRAASAYSNMIFRASAFSFLSWGTTQGLYQSATGNVGIGTTTPNVPLQVEGLSGVYRTGLRVDTDDSTFGPTLAGYTSRDGVERIFFRGNFIAQDDQSIFYGTSSSFKTLYRSATNMFVIGDQVGNDFLSIVDQGSAGDIRLNNGQMFIASTGNVGIGTTTPGATLTIASATATGYSPVLHVASSSGSLFSVLANGNVGIGVEASTHKLRVNANGEAFYIGDGTNTSTYFSANGRAYLGYNATSGNALIQALSGKGIEFNVNNVTAGSGTAMVVKSDGNVGIGTSTPGSKLDIWSTTASSDVDLFRLASAVGGVNNVVFRIDSDGDMFTDGAATIGTPADIAESYTAMEAVDAGTVVAFATTTTAWSPTNGADVASASSTDVYEISGVRKAHDQYEAVGIVSTRPGIHLGANIVNGVPVALSGRVPVKVTDENGPVMRGDYITVSLTRPGYAMKLTGEGKALGRALSDYTAGNDKVMIYIENGYQKVDMAGKHATTTGMLTTGNVDLNANGVAIINIKSLASANGSWSIDENGRIVAKQLCLEDVCIDKTQLTNILNASGQSPVISGQSGTGSSGSTGTTTPPGEVAGASTSTDPGAGTDGGSETPVDTPPAETAPVDEIPTETASEPTPAPTPEVTEPATATEPTPPVADAPVEEPAA